MSVTLRPLDTEEERLIREFARHGCSCDYGKDRSPCCKSFTEEHYLSLRCAFSEMTHDELDLFIMGQIMATCHQSPHSDSADKTEKHNVMHFYHQGKRVCQQTFLFLHNVGIKR